MLNLIDPKGLGFEEDAGYLLEDEMIPKLSALDGLKQEDYLKIIAKRIMISKGIVVFYIGIIFLSCVHLLWALLTGDGCSQDIYFQFLEAVIVGALVVDISIRILAQREKYLKVWWNYFDLLVLLLCGVSFVICFQKDESSLEEVEEMVSTTLLAIRASLYLARIILILSKLKAESDKRNVDDIDLNGLDKNAFKPTASNATEWL
eukprot:TRINITY_DN782229_c0_g1_i1.p1 TRINITY_DN782229_c0_g1~~TRINITY_DN782229_c0_g1_i1.p1  ORF type:complete len:205 (-),score=30.82 TRINITY_DN782229_c0_g1_i1:141-755(-)